MKSNYINASMDNIAGIHDVSCLFCYLQKYIKKKVYEISCIVAKMIGKWFRKFYVDMVKHK